MIKIEKYADVEPDFFKGRAFGESNEVNFTSQIKFKLSSNLFHVHKFH